MPPRQNGVTIIEVLIALAVLAVASGYVLPSFQALIKRVEATTSINWLVTHIHYARQTAITAGTTVTLCPSIDGEGCNGRWHDGMLIFTDANRNAKIDSQDAVLKWSQSSTTGTIKWRSFRNRQYLQMTSDGMTNYQNGNFVYCSKDQDPRFSRQIVINMQGRVRKSYDSNGDGIREDRYGKSLRC